jgi:hypothetical protein
MTITNENIKAQLGYDPTNPHYMAVQDVLSSGVPSVAGFPDTMPRI